LIDEVVVLVEIVIMIEMEIILTIIILDQVDLVINDQEVVVQYVHHDLIILHMITNALELILLVLVM
jgi:hypothetical protein